MSKKRPLSKKVRTDIQPMAAPTGDAPTETVLTQEVTEVLPVAETPAQIALEIADETAAIKEVTAVPEDVAAEVAPVKTPAKRGRKPGTKNTTTAKAKKPAVKAEKTVKAAKTAAAKADKPAKAEKPVKATKPAVKAEKTVKTAKTAAAKAEKTVKAEKPVKTAKTAAAKAEKPVKAVKTTKTAAAKADKPAKAAKPAAVKAEKPVKAVKTAKTTAKKGTTAEKPAPKTRGPRKKSISFDEVVALAQTTLNAVKPSDKIMKIPVNIILHGGAEGTFYVLIENGAVDVQPYRYEDSAVDIRISTDNFIKLTEKKFAVAEGIASRTFEVTGDYKKAMIACFALFA
jgi:hypothetical protein